MTSTETPAPIRPRTEGERKAYVQGWAAAINAVNDDGLEKARTYLQPMVEAEYPKLREELDKTA